MINSFWYPPNSSTTDVRPWDVNGLSSPYSVPSCSRLPRLRSQADSLRQQNTNFAFSGGSQNRAVLRTAAKLVALSPCLPFRTQSMLLTLAAWSARKGVADGPGKSSANRRRSPRKAIA